MVNLINTVITGVGASGYPNDPSGPEPDLNFMG